ncbi:hypothetical protein Tco_0643901, partial [Tanacetum coccineum]
MLIDEKVNSSQKIQESKPMMNHLNPEKSNDPVTLGHNCVILVRGGVLAESSRPSKFSVGRHIKEPIRYLDSGCSRSMNGVKSYLHKYVEQPGPK